jgi:hypothetical protein
VEGRPARHEIVDLRRERGPSWVPFLCSEESILEETPSAQPKTRRFRCDCNGGALQTRSQKASSYEARNVRLTADAPVTDERGT